MLSLDRKFHCKGVLFIRKSKYLPNLVNNIEEDVVNWFFLKIGDYLYGFVYEALDRNTAQYEQSFDVEISIFAFDVMKEKIKLDNVYKVFRGQEEIGLLKIIDFLD